MGSKILILLGLSVAFVLLISSQVAATYFAETTSKNGGGHYHGGGGSDSYNEIGSAQSNIDPSCSSHGGGGHYGRGGGGHGGGGGGGRGRCIHCCGLRCCSEAEALEATQVKPQN